MCVSLPSQLTQTTSSDPFLCSSPMKIETRQPWFSESALSFFLSPYTVSSMLKPFTHTHHKHTNSLSHSLSLSLSLLSLYIYIYISIYLSPLSPLFLFVSPSWSPPSIYRASPCFLSNRFKQVMAAERARILGHPVHLSHFALDCSISLK